MPPVTTAIHTSLGTFPMAPIPAGAVQTSIGQFGIPPVTTAVQNSLGTFPMPPISTSPVQTSIGPFAIPPVTTAVHTSLGTFPMAPIAAGALQTSIGQFGIPPVTTAVQNSLATFPMPPIPPGTVQTSIGPLSISPVTTGVHTSLGTFAMPPIETSALQTSIGTFACPPLRTSLGTLPVAPIATGPVQPSIVPFTGPPISAPSLQTSVGEIAIGPVTTAIHTPQRSCSAPPIGTAHLNTDIQTCPPAAIKAGQETGGTDIQVSAGSLPVPAVSTDVQPFCGPALRADIAAETQGPEQFTTRPDPCSMGTLSEASVENGVQQKLQQLREEEVKQFGHHLPAFSVPSVTRPIEETTATIASQVSRSPSAVTTSAVEAVTISIEQSAVILGTEQITSADSPSSVGTVPVKSVTTVSEGNSETVQATEVSTCHHTSLVSTFREHPVNAVIEDKSSAIVQNHETTDHTESSLATIPGAAKSTVREETAVTYSQPEITRFTTSSVQSNFPVPAVKTTIGQTDSRIAASQKTVLAETDPRVPGTDIKENAAISSQGTDAVPTVQEVVEENVSIVLSEEGTKDEAASSGRKLPVSRVTSSGASAEGTLLITPEKTVVEISGRQFIGGEITDARPSEIQNCPLPPVTSVLPELCSTSVLQASSVTSHSSTPENKELSSSTRYDAEEFLASVQLSSFTKPDFSSPSVNMFQQSSLASYSMGRVDNHASTSDSNEFSAMRHCNVYGENNCYQESSADSPADTSKGQVIPDESFELSPGKVALIQATEPIPLHIHVQRSVPDILAGTGADEREFNKRSDNENKLFSDTDSSEALEEANERLQRTLLQLSEEEEEDASAEKQPKHEPIETK